MIPEASEKWLPKEGVFLRGWWGMNSFNLDIHEDSQAVAQAAASVLELIEREVALGQDYSR